jgi:Flp pilus assembly pilin Flp
MIKRLLLKLWHDEDGAIVATEYLMLGSIVAAGGVGGMVAMRDAMIDEFREFGQTTREIRQAYTQEALKYMQGRKRPAARSTSPYYPVPAIDVNDPASTVTFAIPHPTP